MARNFWEWKKIVLEAKVQNGMQCVRSRRRNPIKSLNEVGLYALLTYANVEDVIHG
jgi:hypothetical protein